MRVITLFLYLCFSVAALAQNYDFEKVSKEELEEKYNPLDSTAHATYLYKKRRTYIEYDQNYGFQLITDIHERIKIYTKDGFDYATQQVELYKSGSDQEKISSIKANTYNLVDGNIEETKLDKNGIFKTEISKYYDETKFTMPNIKEGSVIEYKYNITSPFYSNVDDFVFQHAIPVKVLKATFETPEYFNFKLNTKGYLEIKPKIETKNDKITFTSKERSGGAGFQVSTTTFNSSSLDFFKTITTYNLSDIPALKDEPFVNNINNYRSAIQYELSYTKFPDGALKYYATTWEDVVKTIYESSNFGLELDRTGYFETEVNALIAGISDPLVRASLIFNFVKTKIKWNAYIGKYTDVGVRKAYKDQVGNVAEINLMLTAMLRHAGLNANPVLVSSRQNGIPLFPTLEGYNYVISCIETEQGVILLDASNKYAIPNILPTRALNWEGLIIRKNKTSSTINLYPSESSKKTVTLLFNLDDSGTLKGNIRSLLTSHNAMSFREDYMGTNKEQFLEKLENKYKGIDIEDYEVINDINLSEPITETYKFTLENQADVIGDKIYFSPMFFLKTSENPFKLEKREFPVDFGFPSDTSYRILINIPEGYKVESLPEPIALVMPDNLAEFSYNIVDNGKSIQVRISDKINTTIVSSIYYDSLKPYFSKLIEKQAEKIVLTKIK